MRKLLAITGIVFVIAGVILGILELFSFFSSKPSVGTITDILERREGTEYFSVTAGGIYPCELKIAYTDTNGNRQMGKTPNETRPCSNSFTNYYKVGDKVNILYYVNNPSLVRMSGLPDTFGFLLIFPIFGFGLIYLSKRLGL